MWMAVRTISRRRRCSAKASFKCTSLCVAYFSGVKVVEFISDSTKKGNIVRAFGAILKLVSILQQRVLAFILSLNSLAPSHGRSLCSHAIREEVKQNSCS